MLYYHRAKGMLLRSCSKTRMAIGPSMTKEETDDAASSLSQAEMLENLEQQLIALYQEKQEGLSSSAAMNAMQETVDNLEAQIVELYREKEAEAESRAVMAQKDETISNLEAQLVSLYQERDCLAHAA